MDNNSNVFLNHFYQKIVNLKKVAIDTNALRSKVIEEIDKIVQYCKSDKSLQQMKCFQSFFHYAFSYANESHDNDYNTFMLCLKIDCKHAIYQTIERDGIKYRLLVPRSISFNECSQKDRTSFFNTSKQVIFDKYGIPFDDWFMHYQSNENTI